ncbi:MAG TPA: AI-2E family transporter [Acidobacteriaceae bacterium]|nr:AI-2E family transporter [Acidobacteriaceae bacterium]
MTSSPLPATTASSQGRSVRGNILFTFAIAIVLYLAWLLRDVLVLLYVSALFAVVLTPIVRAVQRIQIGGRHPGPGLAIFIIMGSLLGGIAVFLILTVPPLVHDFTTFLQSFPGRTPHFLARLERMPLLKHVNLKFVETRLKQDTARNVGAFVSSAGDWAAKFFQVITGLVLTIYFLAEGRHVYAWVLSLVPEERRERLDETLQHAAARMGKWLLGQGVLMLILGICSGIVFGLMKLRYALALAVLMGAFNIVPVVGALVSTSIAMAVAVSDSWGKVLGVMIFELIYAQVENAFLIPRIMKTSVDLAGTAVLIALLLGVSLAGVAGALVAVPSAVLITVLIEEYVIEPGSVVSTPIRP